MEQWIGILGEEDFQVLVRQDEGIDALLVQVEPLNAVCGGG
jgi:hypothetical protein